MSSHIIDSKLFHNNFSTNESRSIFSELAILQRWYDIEMALAKSQADIGIIPVGAYEDLSSIKSVDQLDINKISDDVCKTGHSLIPLLNEIKRKCKTGKNWLHYGATTQDIQDTSQSIEIKEVLIQVESNLLSVMKILESLIKKNLDTLIIGRTHGVPALPTTFAARAATWLDELVRLYKKIGKIREEVCVIQLYGGVGTMSAFDCDTEKLLSNFAKELRLSIPLYSWHVARDRVTTFTCFMTQVSGCLARMSDNIRSMILSGLIFYDFDRSNLGSSTMPHKYNPEIFQQIVTLFNLSKGVLQTSFSSHEQEYERDSRGTRTEWVTVPEISHYLLCSLKKMQTGLKGISVNHKQINEEFLRYEMPVSSEAIAFYLSQKIGLIDAINLIRSIYPPNQEVTREDLINHEQLQNLLSENEINKILNHKKALDNTRGLVLKVLAEYKLLVKNSNTNR